MDIKAVVSSIFEASSLRFVPRSHQQRLFTTDPSDNIGSHTALVCAIGDVLATIVPGVDRAKVLRMCLYHDRPEARCGDQNWLHKSYVTVDEEKIRGEQFATIGKIDPSLVDLMVEYEERKTLEARVGKDADSLAQHVLIIEYAFAGNKEAARWMETHENKRRRLFTEEARTLFDEIIVQRPSAWWDGLQTPTRK